MPVTYDSIATTTLGSAASTITFSSIPGTFTDLRLVFVTNGTSSPGSAYVVRFNSDSGTNYSNTRLQGTGTAASSDRGTNNNSIWLHTNNGLAASTPQLSTTDIFSYAGSTNKTALTLTSSDLNGSGAVAAFVGLWRNTAAITSISIVYTDTTFAAGTTATLYGILRA